MGLITKSYFFCKVLFLKFFSHRGTVIVYDTKKTLQTLLYSKYSISRFGDGELNLIMGKDIPFQKYSKALSKKLLEVLQDAKNNNNCLIGIPIAMFSLKSFNMKSCAFWIRYSNNNKNKIMSLLNEDVRYYDSQVTRIYINRSSRRQSSRFFGYWKTLFSGKDILIVEGNKTRFGVGNKLLLNASRIRRIECSSENAFNQYEKIKTKILKYECDIVLLALGPTATVLAYDLSNYKRVIDIGNLDIEYEWYLRKKKEKIEGKYSIEVPMGYEVSSINDAKYESEIIEVIS